MTSRSLSVAAVVVATTILGPQVVFANSTQVLISHGLVTQDQGDGADLFFRGTFGGNGRTCGTCHPPDNNQTIDPAFVDTLPPDDPFFITDEVPNLELEPLLSDFALILENVDGFENPTEKFLMRGVPHTLSLATSITASTGFPEPQNLGSSGDGSADGTLNGFPTGAVTQHFPLSLDRVDGVDFDLPTQTELNKMEAFMASVGRLTDINMANVTLSEADADTGREIFLNDGSNVTIAAGKCATCHADAGANVSFGDQANHNFDIGIEEVPHPARQVVSFPFDGGFGTQLNSEGTFGDGTFATPPLIEAADTGPYFHNAVIPTLEEAVYFFSSPEFNNSPGATVVGGISLTTAESDQVAAFLRVVNAAFNLAISVQRNAAGISLENSSSGGCGGGGGGIEVEAAVEDGGGACTQGDGGGTITGKRETIDTLLALANAEAADAIEVLNAQGLNGSAISLIQTGINKNQQAIGAGSSNVRKNRMQEAKAAFEQAKAQLGTGLSFTLGQGNLLF